jgi:hypothetical protein
MGIIGPFKGGNLQFDPRSRRTGNYFGGFRAPLEFGFEGLQINTRQNARSEVFKIIRQGRGDFTFDTDTNGNVILTMTSVGGATMKFEVSASNSFSVSMNESTDTYTRVFLSETGAQFPWKQIESAVNVSPVQQNAFYAITAGDKTVTLSDGNWATGQLTDGDWLVVYDQNGNAAANPITVDCSGSTVNGVSTNLIISENYGGYYFQYNNADTEWVAWKMQPAHENTSGIVAGVVASSVDITLTGSNYTVLMSPIVAARTVNLPAAANHKGRIYNVKHAFNTSNAVTIDGNGSETIDGATTQTLAYLASLTIQCDGSNWHIL